MSSLYTCTKALEAFQSLQIPNSRRRSSARATLANLTRRRHLTRDCARTFSLAAPELQSANVRSSISTQLQTAIEPQQYQDAFPTNNATHLSAIRCWHTLTSYPDSFPTTIRERRDLWIQRCRGQCFQSRATGCKGSRCCYKWCVSASKAK